MRASGAAGEQFKMRDAETAHHSRRGRDLVKEVTGDANYNDVNFVFPTSSPRTCRRVVGLLIAAIFAAAMSATRGELSALSTASVHRLVSPFHPTEASDRHFLLVSRSRPCSGVCSRASSRCLRRSSVADRGGESLRARTSTGRSSACSFLAIGFPRATSNGAFIGLLAG
jgi:hypothetical protein